MLDLLRLVFQGKTRRLRERDVESATFYSHIGDFAPYYHAKILPHVKVFELTRMNALRLLRRRIRLSIPASIGLIGLITIVGSYFIPNIDFGFVVMSSLVVFGGFSTWCYTPVFEFKTSVKDKIFPLIFSFFEGGWTHNAKSPLKVTHYQESELIPSYDNEEPGDYIKGIYKNVPLELHETKLTARRGSGKNRRTVTIFQGLFVYIKANKIFKGKTIVRRDYGLLNWAVNGLQSRERVKLEDPEFEKKFDVYADNQVEARYLLTTSFMDRLLNLIKLFQTDSLQCSFYGNHLLIMIPTEKDYFETGSIFKPATFIDEINVILEEMHTIFGIIDTLKLDEKTGL